MNEKDFQRFFSKVDTNGDGGCWNWVASTDGRGYGSFHINGKIEKAHRVSYEYFFGEIQNDLFVCHICIGNPKCVNPLHLYAGTAQDNVNDIISQGRQSTKLKISDIDFIRHLYKNKSINGITQNILAKMFKVNIQTINKIINNKSWRPINCKKFVEVIKE